MTFGPSSSLEWIGVSCFERTEVEEVAVPDGVRELCEGCFKSCTSLQCVTFGPSSSLERIGAACFQASGVKEVAVPDGVRELCEGCFKQCRSLHRVTFGLSSSLERIGAACFQESGVEEVAVPDSVCELCDCCFTGCWGLRCVTFGPSSSLERIGVEAFAGMQDRFGESQRGGLVEISIPDGVHELCDGCFRGCSNLCRVTFGASSALERIGVEAFGAVRDWRGSPTPCGLVEISIPDGVRELCHGCFIGCSSLRHVVFSRFSSLERIGFHAFPRSVSSSA